jgi:hypothetical protein
MTATAAMSRAEKRSSHILIYWSPLMSVFLTVATLPVVRNDTLNTIPPIVLSRPVLTTYTK